jgi:hypothetical protein
MFWIPIFAPETRAPEASVTVPESVAPTTCARAEQVKPWLVARRRNVRALEREVIIGTPIDAAAVYPRLVETGVANRTS